MPRHLRWLAMTKMIKYILPGSWVKMYPTKTFVFVGTPRPRMTGVCGGNPAPQDDKRVRNPAFQDDKRVRDPAPRDDRG